MIIHKTKTAVSPSYNDTYSPGMDIYIDTEIEYSLQPGETYLLPTGLSMQIPKNCFGVVYPINNLLDKGLNFGNGPIILKPDERKLVELKIPIKNVSSDVVFINGFYGIRTPIAQLIIQPYKYEKVEITS